MVEKIKGRLKDLFPKANLSNKRLDEYTAKLQAKFNEESTDEDIDNVLKDYNEIINFEEVARQDDRLRSFESKKTEEPKPQKTEDLTLLEKFEALEQKLNAYETQNKTKTLHERVLASESLKGVPKEFIEGFLPTVSEDNFEEKVESIKSFATQYKIGSLGVDVPPSGGKNNPKAPTQTEIDNIIKEIKI